MFGMSGSRNEDLGRRERKRKNKRPLGFVESGIDPFWSLVIFRTSEDMVDMFIKIVVKRSFKILFDKRKLNVPRLLSFQKLPVKKILHLPRIITVKKSFKTF